MQPKTDRQTSKPDRSFGWFGLLMIAIISGLVIKLVGDPLVTIVTPKVEDAAEEAEDWVDDQNWVEDWQEHWKERIKEWLSQAE